MKKVILALSLISSAAHGALVEHDLYTAGDNLITLDTKTGIQWLDLTATTNLSYNDILADAGGWISSGWRHATIGEIDSLYSAFGLENRKYSPPNRNEIDMFTDLFSLLGETAPDENETYRNSYGLVGGDFSDFRPLYGMLLADDGSWATTGYVGGSIDRSASPILGHWMVKTTAVPIPSSFLLFLSGLSFFYFSKKN